ncbi:MAG: DUF2914 domain-containing protein [Deltaproteobacteria bacterium]|nr:DUF2914 domain-containing protein [Deltaproteobacteria bacterium]
MKKSILLLLAAMLIQAFTSFAIAEDPKTGSSVVTVTGSGAAPTNTTPTAKPQGATLSVMESAIATGIKDAAPVGPGEKFPASVGKLYCYTRIAGASAEALVTHKWFLNGKLLDAIVLRVKGDPYRIYSAKTVTPYMKGDWKVEVVDESGKLLKTINFKVE